jgi:hypothetical protein
MTENEQA